MGAKEEGRNFHDITWFFMVVFSCFGSAKAGPGAINL